MAEGEPLSAGDTTRTLTVDDRQREYLLHVPPQASQGKPLPVVLVFHGGGSSAKVMVRFSGMNETADKHGFVAVYPSGSGRLEAARTWNAGNCCGYAQRQQIDDVKFVAALLDELERSPTIDNRRIYATGMSNGALLCYLLADKLSDRLAAIGPVAGPMGTETCAPKRPVPVVHFHGTEDAFAPYAGGRGRRSVSQTDFYSVEHTIAAWVNANHAEAKPQVTELPVQQQDGTRVTRSLHAAGPQGAEVALYTIHGAGHTWPGRTSLFNFLGVSTKNLSANEVMWEFFSRHTRQ